MDTYIDYATLFVVFPFITCLTCWGISALASMSFLTVFGTKHFARKAAKELGISKETVLARFAETVALAQENCRQMGFRVRFSDKYVGTRVNGLGIDIKKETDTILYSPLWIYKVVTSPEIWPTAFLQSVGHEVSHYLDPNKGRRFHLRRRAEKRFYRWLCEVRCDFEGVHFACHFCGYTRDAVITAVSEKARLYDEQRLKWPWNKSLDSRTHPSWERRVALLQKYDKYCAEVIEEVALAAGCANRAFIEELYSSLLPF